MAVVLLSSQNSKPEAVTAEMVCEVPALLVRKLRSNQTATPTVSPVITTVMEKGTLTVVVPAPAVEISVPTVVPVNAAPLVGAVPVPYLNVTPANTPPVAFKIPKNVTCMRVL